jgi:hypothetical protein
MAVRSLKLLFDEKAQLFRTMGVNPHTRETNGASKRQTIVAALGLAHLQGNERSLFELRKIQTNIFQDRSWVESAGDLGLLTWFTAECMPEQLDTVFNEFDFDSALTDFADAKSGETVGLSFFLAGIAHAAIVSPNSIPRLSDAAAYAYRALQNNQHSDGLFGHALHGPLSRRPVRRRFGTFADQTFAIYAMSTFVKALGVEEPLESALSCANAICALQGEMGQWWFQYDKKSSRVGRHYPLFSLHQDGTAPCALLALEGASGQSFKGPIFKGLSWSANVAAFESSSRGKDVAWHSIAPKERFSERLRSALAFLGLPDKPRDQDLFVRYEARPDRFGWMLYAFGQYGLLPEAAQSA